MLCFLVFFALIYSSCKSKKEIVLDVPPNVLLICIDDLRNDLGAYGNTLVKSPNIDALAASGHTFRHHYVQSAICGPSRSSFLTGRISQQWDPWAYYRATNLEPETPISLPHLFKKNGYRTVGIGKISHEPGGVLDSLQTKAQIPFSWDSTYTAVGRWKTPWRSFFAYANGDAHNKVMGIGLNTPHLPYEAGNVDNMGYPDGLNTQEAIKHLERFKKTEEPFFLALGFNKPHLPFNAPKKYWDLYDPEKIPLASNNFAPKNLNNPYSINQSPELTTHYPWPEGPGKVGEASARKLTHGYYACISYIDALVGQLMTTLERLELDENTVVVLWSDHGWQLGEHTMFGKMSNFEVATASPLIIRLPKDKNGGKTHTQFVESVDIYPTLADICKLPAITDLDGQSLTPIMYDNAPGKGYARSFYYRKGALGKSLRTPRHRFVRWANDQDSTLAMELYDHKLDPNENNNIALEHPNLTDSLSLWVKNLKYLDPDAPFRYGWE
jgi:arylsulfatase A-like enzyme